VRTDVYDGIFPDGHLFTFEGRLIVADGKSRTGHGTRKFGSRTKRDNFLIFNFNFIIVKNPSPSTQLG